MQNVRLTCSLVNNDLIDLEFTGPELIGQLMGDGTGATPKYLTIEADAPDGQRVRIVIPNREGNAKVSIKPTMPDNQP